MVTGQDPMVQRRRLRVELRKAREQAGLTQKEAAPRVDWSLSKLIRIETGTVGITVNDLRALLQLYQITDQGRVNELIELARSAREPAWWTPYRNVISQEFRTYLGYESTASIIRNFQPLLVPGLLQTEEYARATLAELHPSTVSVEPDTLEQVDLLVDLRLERQERIAQRPSPPKLFYGIDEAAIHRWVGGPEVMRRQLRRLKEALAQSGVTIWIVPYTAGLYQRMRLPYVLFEFPAEEDEDVLYLEATRGDQIERNDPQETAVYLEAFWRLEQLALKNEDAGDLIDQAIERLSETAKEEPAERTPTP